MFFSTVTTTITTHVSLLIDGDDDRHSLTALGFEAHDHRIYVIQPSRTPILTCGKYKSVLQNCISFFFIGCCLEPLCHLSQFVTKYAFTL